MPRFLSMFVLIGMYLVLSHPALAQEPGKKGQTAPAATVTRTVKVGELTRSYALHVPAELPKDKPAAVVLVFHGGGGTPAQIERQTKFSDLADRTFGEGDGFIVVYPEGVGKSWNDGRGAQDVVAQRDNIDDLGFVAALIDDLAKVHTVDANRVFATGISNGAIFSHFLAANLSARIAAIAPVVGGLGEPASAKFAPEKPVSVLILQGADDPLVPYNGGNVTPPLVGAANKRGRIISTDEAVKKWAAHNGCQPDALVKDGEDVADTDKDDGCHAKRFTWSKGKDGTEVVLYRIEGGGHTWPGAVEPLPKRLVGNVCRDFNATEVIWEFFKMHPKPANSAPVPASTAVAAPAIPPQRTGVVFSTGFEEEKPAAVWENYDGVFAVTVKDPGPMNREGNTVMRFRAPPGERGGGGVVKVLPDKKGYDKLYARWYVKYEKGFNFDAPSHGSGLHGGERWLNGRSGIRPDGTDMVSVCLDSCNKPAYKNTPFLYTYYRGMYQDCGDPNGRCWGDAFPCVSDAPGQVHYGTKPQHRPKGELPRFVADKWYRVDIMVDLGTPTPTEAGANGTMELKIDGVSLGRWDDLWMRTTPDLKLILLHLGLFHHDGTHSEVGVLYDDVVVSTEPIADAPAAIAAGPDRSVGETLSAKYPGDVGIEKDPDVIFAEGFEGEKLPEAAWEKPGGFYDIKGFPALMHTAGNVGSNAAVGTHCLELVHPKGEVSPQWMHRRFAGTDTVYVRFYRKFDKDWAWAPQGIHDTFLFAGEYKSPTSTDLTLYFDISGVDQQVPAWLPLAGTVFSKQPVSILRSAFQGAGGKSGLDFGLGKEIVAGEDFKWYYWLPFNASPGPVLKGGRWYCFEQMAKMNSTPDAKDGEVRMWIDGVLVTELTGMTLRNAEHKTIQWDHWMLGPRYGNWGDKGEHQGPPREIRSWIDGLVVATRRVGPVSISSAMSAPASTIPGLAVGEHAPDATLTGLDGKPVQLASLYKDGPIVLTFYRGGWCPFCNRALSAWHDKMEALKAAGGTFIALTPEKPDLAAATREKAKGDYAVYCDTTQAAATAFKVRFAFDEATKAKYKGYGVDLAANNASGTWELPAPATFVIDKEGVIRWAFADWDYKKRADPDEVIAAVKALAENK